MGGCQTFLSHFPLRKSDESYDTFSPKMHRQTIRIQSEPVPWLPEASGPPGLKPSSELGVKPASVGQGHAFFYIPLG